jgi:hypothetical protein
VSNDKPLPCPGRHECFCDWFFFGLTPCGMGRPCTQEDDTTEGDTPDE